jgi:hypothetical protein
LDFLEHDLESGYRFSGCSNNLPKRDSDRALVLAVLLGVVPARLYVMMLGVAGMAVGGVRMMRGLLMIAGLVMLGGLPMMLRRMLMVLGRLLVMLHALMLAHISLPV